MADPEVDHVFVFREDRTIEILASPFYEVNPEIDADAKEYLDRVCHCMAEDVTTELCIHNKWKIRLLHPSYAAFRKYFPPQSPKVTEVSPLAQVNLSPPAGRLSMARCLQALLISSGIFYLLSRFLFA